MGHEGQTIYVGEGYPVKVTRDLLHACNAYGWAVIIDRQHPGEGYDKTARTSLERLYTQLRAQVPQDRSDPSTDFPDWHLKFLAKWLGSWDIEHGHAKGQPAIKPVRSTMDIPLNPARES